MKPASQLPVSESIEISQQQPDLDKEKAELNRTYTTSIAIGYVAGMGAGNPTQITNEGQVWYDC